MSDKELLVWHNAVQLVPTIWIAEFTRLVEEGEASDDFLTFFRASDECQRAFEMILQADDEVADLVQSSFGQRIVDQSPVT